MYERGKSAVSGRIEHRYSRYCAAGSSMPGYTVQKARVQDKVLGEVFLGPDIIHPEIPYKK
jgi:hypothetical protein